MLFERVGVVTPLGTERDQLPGAIASVMRQTLRPALHVVVVDGGQPVSRDPRVQYISLPSPCEDTGATPREIGSAWAIAQHCDALAFLDADNTWDEDHLASCRETAAGCDVIVSSRRILDWRGDLLFEDATDSDGQRFADTNCIVLTGPALGIARSWGNVPHVPGLRTAAVDRFFWTQLKRLNVVVGRTGQTTVNYRTRWEAHYRGRENRRPPKCKRLVYVDGLPVVEWV